MVVLNTVHLRSEWYEKVGFTSENSALRGWFLLLETNGFRLFHKEINALHGAKCCIEYAFIHKDLEQVFGTHQLEAYFKTSISEDETSTSSLGH